MNQAPGIASADQVVISGFDVTCGAGRDPQALLEAVLAGRPAFTPVTRFDVSGRRARAAATLPGSPVLFTEIADVIEAACADAQLTGPQRADCPLMLAVRVDYQLARMSAAERADWSGAGLARALAQRCGLSGALRTYTGACVAGSTAVADAACMVAAGRLPRVVVAAGYLVDPDHFALFDAGRALSDDVALRPFSTGRRGILFGDAIVAVVLESGTAARRRGVPAAARLAGWVRAGDAYHVCRPDPTGDGIARAIGSALRRAGIGPDELGYVNANGTGTAHADAAESNGLSRALGACSARIPVSSTKSVHGHALEASGLLELVVTVLALGCARLPVNAGFLGPDDECRLDLVLDAPRPAASPYMLSVNAAFGGANTALVIGAP